MKNSELERKLDDEISFVKREMKREIEEIKEQIGYKKTENRYFLGYFLKKPNVSIHQKLELLLDYLGLEIAVKPKKVIFKKKEKGGELNERK